jgi:hypothetical protein
MNRDDIIKLAGHREVPPWVMKLVQDCLEAEREACAKAVERSYLYVDGSHGVGYHDWHIAERVTAHCIAAIRARGER